MVIRWFATEQAVALQRGPLVYCLEQADNGEALHNLLLPRDAGFTVFEGKGLFAHKMLIQARATENMQKTPMRRSCGATITLWPPPFTDVDLYSLV